MLRNYQKTRSFKFNPEKVSHDHANFVNSFVLDTMYYDKEFHKFAYDTYGIHIQYDKEKEKFFVNP